MKLFKSAKSGSARLGVFGKLPTYGDFMSQHADSVAAQSLAKWLQEGVGLGAAAQTQEQFLHFIWEPKKARGMALVGCLWPSADAAGRRFPFALFASVPSDTLFAHGGRRIIAAEPIWRQMHDLHAQLLTIGDLSAQYAMLQETTPAAPLDLAAAEQTYAERARTSSLQGAQRVAVALHLRDLVAFADTLRNASTDLAFAARMRVHGHVDPDIEAATWLQILAAQLGNRDPSGALFVRVSMGDGHRSVTLFHRDMTATDLGYLLAPAEAYRMADAMGYRTVTASPEDTTFREAFDRRWGSRPSVYGTLLELGLLGWTPAEMAAPVAAPHATPTTGEDPTEAVSTGPLTAEPDDDGDDVITGEVVLDSTEADDGDITGPVQLPDSVTADAVESAPEAAAAVDERPTGEPSAAVDAPTEEAAAPVEEHAAGADEAPADEPATPESPADVDVPDADGHDALVARIRDLASGPLRHGRMVRITADAAEGELGAPDLTIYVADGAESGQPVLSESPLAAQVQRYDEARMLLDELARRHRLLESELEERVSAACAGPDSEAPS